GAGASGECAPHGPGAPPAAALAAAALAADDADHRRRDFALSLPPMVVFAPPRVAAQRAAITSTAQGPCSNFEHALLPYSRSLSNLRDFSMKKNLLHWHMPCSTIPAMKKVLILDDRLLSGGELSKQLTELGFAVVRESASNNGLAERVAGAS